MPRFPKALVKLGWISFLADVASEMAYPVLPLFMRALGAPAAGLGAVEGIAEATVGLIKGMAGFRSDKAKKRVPYVQWGYALSTVGKPLIGLATVWPMVLVARVLDRVGKGIRTSPRDALIAESVEPGDLGAAFGFHRAMDTAGAVLGVLATMGLVALLPGQYRLIFLLAAIPGVASVLLTLTLKEPSPPSDPLPTSGDGEKKTLAEAMRAMPRRYWQGLAVAGVFALANTSDAFLLLRAKESGFSDLAAIGAYAFYNFAYALIAYPAGKLSDKVGRLPLTAVSWLLYAGAYVGFATTGGSMLWVWFLVYGLYQGLYQGTMKAFVAELAPKEWKASALGLFFMGTALATLVGNLAAGFVWDRLGAPTMLLGCAGAAVLATAMLPFVSRHKQPA